MARKKKRPCLLPRLSWKPLQQFPLRLPMLPLRPLTLQQRRLPMPLLSLLPSRSPKKRRSSNSLNPFDKKPPGVTAWRFFLRSHSLGAHLWVQVPLPVDVQINDEDDIPQQALDASSLVEQVRTRHRARRSDSLAPAASLRWQRTA